MPRSRVINIIIYATQSKQFDWFIRGKYQLYLAPGDCVSNPQYNIGGLEIVVSIDNKSITQRFLHQ